MVITILQKRKKITILFIKISIIICFCGVISTLFEVLMLRDIYHGVEIDEHTILMSDFRQLIFGLVEMILYIITLIFFCRWIFHAVKVAQANKEFSYTPGWSVGYYFIPILNIFRPYQVMRALYHKNSDKSLSAPSIIKWWWATWLIFNFSARAAFRISLKAETVFEIYMSSYAILINDILYIPLCWLLWKVVETVTNRLEPKQTSFQNITYDELLKS